jgi:hypothetical protein
MYGGRFEDRCRIRRWRFAMRGVSRPRITWRATSSIQHRVGETYRFTYNPNHSWFYFPNMQRDEALLIKCYDSKQDGRARFTAHTAFDDPSSPPNAAPRESIEIRALVFWAPENNG